MVLEEPFVDLARDVGERRLRRGGGRGSRQRDRTSSCPASSPPERCGLASALGGSPLQPSIDSFDAVHAAADAFGSIEVVRMSDVHERRVDTHPTVGGTPEIDPIPAVDCGDGAGSRQLHGRTRNRAKRQAVGNDAVPGHARAELFFPPPIDFRASSSWY